jgi:hypothetical protein
MSRSYIAICPCNPLLPNTDIQSIVKQLKEAGFIDHQDYQLNNPETNETEVFYKPGNNYLEFYELDADVKTDIGELLKHAVIEFKVHDKIEVEVFPSGEFEVTNPVTGSLLEEDWSEELGEFLEDNDHQWVDPENGKPYYFFELKCDDIALGRQFITIEDGWGEPNEKLMQLLKTITGQDYRWIWAGI